MDNTEDLARRFLLDSGFAESEIVYEPDGNVPPDFLVQGRIAVEVRRLNQNVEEDDGFRGLEEDDVRLYLGIRKLLRSLGPSRRGRCFYVSYHFKRPLPPRKEIRAELRRFLETSRDQGCASGNTERIHANFRVDIVAAGMDHGDYFVPGVVVDDDSGGWVIPEMERNLSLVLAEKSKKTAAVRQRYPEWWLVLVDHIGFGLDEHDQSMFREQVTLVHDWHRVVMLDPTDPKRWFELE